MKKILAALVAIGSLTAATASQAQLTTSTLKIIRGTSLVNFTATGTGTTTYTWPQAPSATKPMQVNSSGAITFAPLSLSDNTNQVTGVLGIANGGTNSSTSLTNGRMMISSGDAIVENEAGTANQILLGDLTWGALDLATSQVTGVLPVANGGTGASTIAQNAVVLGNGSDPLQSVSLGNNQLLVGYATGAPTARTIVGGNGITVGIDSNNITITSTMSGSSSATGQAVYTSDGTQLLTVTPGIPVAATSRIILTVTDNVGGNLIAAGVTAITATSFTISVSTDVDCRINWIVTNP